MAKLTKRFPDDTPALPQRERVVKSPEQALRRLMNLCAKSEKCTSDARKALYRWRVDPAVHETVIQKLVEQKFIDDTRYAAAYVREKANLSRWGSYKIRQGLRTKQISEEIITEALAQLDARDMSRKLEEQLHRKMRTIKAKSRYDLRAKLLRYGVGLGFSYGEVNESIEQLIEHSENSVTRNEAHQLDQA